MIENKKRSRDELESHNPAPNSTMIDGKKRYRPSSLRLESLPKAQTASARRRPYENGLTEQRRTVAADQFSSFDDKIPFQLNTTSHKHYERRRGAIDFLFRLFDCPPEEEWKEGDLVGEIMRRLAIPLESKRLVITVLQNIVAAEESGVGYNASKQQSAVSFITDTCHNGKKVFELLQRDIQPTQVTALLNEYRQAVFHEPPVSRACVLNFINRSTIINKSVRQKRKSGSKDQGSPWAQMRKAQAQMTLDRFELGDTENPANWDNFATTDENELKPLWLDSMVAWDGKHTNIRLGPGGNMEYRISVDENGVPTSPADGGAFPPRHSVTTVKQPGQGRALFGSSVRETVFRSGQYYGVSALLQPFDYTDKWIETPKDFQKSLDHEWADKLAQGKINTPTGKDSVWRGGYARRYADPVVADQKLREAVGKKKVNIKDMIDHIWRESKALFAGTRYEKCFTIYHDHLKLMWGKEGVAYMKQIGMWPHMLKIEKPYHHLVGKVWQDCVGGDSPENASGLDRTGFQAMQECFLFHVALTTDLPLNDPNKWNLGTPAAVTRCMFRAWEIAPTPEHTAKDWMALRSIQQQIVDAEGCIVPDIVMRSGHRAVPRADGSGNLESRFRNRQRKSTIGVYAVHESAQGCFDALTEESQADLMEKAELEAELCDDEEEDD